MNYGFWRVDKTDLSLYGDGKWRWIIFDLNSPGFITDLDSIAYAMDNDEMFKNLMTNDAFRTRLLDRIEELTDTVFGYDVMEGILTEYQAFIAEPMRENDKRFFGDDSLSVFYAEMDELKSFFAERKEYLIPVLDQYR